MMKLMKQAAGGLSATLEDIRRRLGILSEQEARLVYVHEAKDRIDLELRLRHLDRSPMSFSSHPGYSWTARV